MSTDIVHMQRTYIKLYIIYYKIKVYIYMYKLHITYYKLHNTYIKYIMVHYTSLKILMLVIRKKFISKLSEKVWNSS